MHKKGLNYPLTLVPDGSQVAKDEEYGIPLSTLSTHIEAPDDARPGKNAVNNSKRSSPATTLKKGSDCDSIRRDLPLIPRRAK